MKLEITDNTKERHIGRNIEKIRSYLGLKQSALAADMGVSQQEISIIEHRKQINEGLLSRIADALGVPSEMVKNFDVEQAIYQINHVRGDIVTQGPSIITQQVNPIEKIVELYERLLKSEQEKIDMLKELNQMHNSNFTSTK